MWDRLRKKHPIIYDALEWFVCGLSVVAAVLAGLTYLSVILA